MEFQAEIKYVQDTIWLLISGTFVMWMAAGFKMLEVGLVLSNSGFNCFRNTRQRISFWPFLALTLVLTAFIYPIQGHWSWGGTALGGLTDGFSDFAGSIIVHSVGGWAALAGTSLVQEKANMVLTGK